MSTPERKAKIERTHALPVSRQCQVLNISRSSAYRSSVLVSEADLDLMQKLDVLHMRHPFKVEWQSYFVPRFFQSDLFDLTALVQTLPVTNNH